MIRWNPESHLLVHHDAASRVPLMAYLNFQEARRCHNHPGLLFNELQKGALAAIKAKILPYATPAGMTEGLQPTVLSQFYAAGAWCASWALNRKLKRRRMDPCASLDAWRVELGADGMAKKVVVAPWFEATLPTVKGLIRIGTPAILKPMQGQVWKTTIGSLQHMGQLRVHPI
jgi:hypothetical protein